MKKLLITVESENHFFARGKHLAALADAAKPLPSQSVISFGDAADLLKILTPARLALITAVKAHQGDSITGIAHRLQRDPSAVKRDVDQLQAAGVFSVQQAVSPGHGLTSSPP